MQLYLVRHGQTDWNIGKQAQGVADIELNAAGIAHGTLLKTLHYNIVGYDETTDLRGFHLDNCELVEYSI